MPAGRPLHHDTCAGVSRQIHINTGLALTVSRPHHGRCSRPARCPARIRISWECIPTGTIPAGISIWAHALPPTEPRARVCVRMCTLHAPGMIGCGSTAHVLGLGQSERHRPAGPGQKSSTQFLSSPQSLVHSIDGATPSSADSTQTCGSDRKFSLPHSMQ